LDDLVDKLDMSDALFGLESLDDSSIDEELAVGEDALLHTLAILLALFLLNGVDCDAFEVRAEPVVDLEGVLLCNRLFDRLFVLAKL